MERKEAIEVVKKNYPHCAESGTQFETALRTLIHELRESDGERIRKALLEYFREQCDMSNWNGVYGYEVYAWLEKQGEHKEYTFNAIPRLLELIQPTDRAKSYCQKLIDSLEQEGYSADAKIVRERLKLMNGENVAMATMDEQKLADNDESIVVRDFNSVFSREQVEEIDKRIEKAQKLHDAKLRDAKRKVEDFPMTD